LAFFIAMADDSEKKEKKITEEVHLVHGKPVLQLRNQDGQFVKQKKIIPTRELTRRGRKILFYTTEHKGKKVSNFERMVLNLVDAVNYEVPEDTAVKDRAAMFNAQGSIFKVLTERVLGNPDPNDSEERTAEAAGNRIVVIIQPPDLINKEEKPAKKESPTKPSFIDAEIIPNPDEV
jgi:hypothetical protein